MVNHTREEVIERAIQEFELLDQLVTNLTEEDWNSPLIRPEGKDPWTVKDALAHITYWRAGVVLSARGEKRPPEERKLQYNARNHLIYLRWRDRSPREVLAWHRQVQEELLDALKTAPEKWFNGRVRGPEWPTDLDQHAAFHRINDIERVLSDKSKE